MNWRQPVILSLLNLSGSKIPSHFQEIKKIQWWSKKKIKAYQQRKLKKLLLHAQRNVPYYQKILSQAGVVDAQGNIHLDKWSRIPILNKEILRKEFSNLKSRDIQKRKTYLNSSGGSIGEPVKFLQDKAYQEWNIANKLFYHHMLGKDVGEKEIKLWGSEQDIFKGTIGLKNTLQNWLYNRKFLNSFRLSPQIIRRYVQLWNQFKPVNVWTYIDSIYQFARFIERDNLSVFPPNAIITTAGVLDNKVRKYIQKILKTKVYDQYGSREVGDIACECPQQKSLHVFEHSHYLEILDKNLKPVKAGETGQIYITSLTNYSMPLIRYQIGDMGVYGRQRHCACKRGFKLIKKITGRITDHFIRKDKTIIHGEYFTHLFYFRPWVKKFKVIQKDYNRVQCLIVKLKPPNKKDLNDIKNKIKLVMGRNCQVEFRLVKHIPASGSGKYLYTQTQLKI